MYRLLPNIFVLILAPLLVIAKIIPEDGARLNYRIIGFSVPGKENTSSYKLQIAEGNLTTEKTFIQHLILSAASKENKQIAEVPDFGKEYTWRVIYEDSHSNSRKTELLHFSTKTCPDVNPDSVRMRITQSDERYNDHYVFVDGNKVLYDMNGKPVWFFPEIEGRKRSTLHLRDLSTTTFGTITFIINNRIYEINYNGAILWQGPENNEASLDTLTPDHGYHHEFIRLANGHYMVMGFEEPYWQLPAPPDSGVYQIPIFASRIKCDHNTCFEKMSFRTILEYDDKGNIVWHWSDGDYFRTSDLHARMLRSKLFDANDTHGNAFYFDEKNQNLFISYRDISRIIQVQYPGGKVLHTYGALYIPGITSDRHLSNGVFCAQHGCRLSKEGYLYLYNNNLCSRTPPTIIMLKVPPPGKDTLEKVWEFECPMDGAPIGNGMFSYGGNVIELEDSTLFVCMGGVFGKVFIVNRDKKVLWSAQPEKWDSNTGQWAKEGVMIDSKQREGHYRANIIDRGQLEKVIWGETTGK